MDENKQLTEEELEMLYEKKRMEKFDINYKREKAQFTEGNNPSFSNMAAAPNAKLIND